MTKYRVGSREPEELKCIGCDVLRLVTWNDEITVVQEIKDWIFCKHRKKLLSLFNNTFSAICCM
jgi:hypothetical protein